MFDNTYGVIPMLHLDTGKVVYAIMLFDGHSFPDEGVYSSKKVAQKKADEMNERLKKDTTDGN